MNNEIDVITNIKMALSVGEPIRTRLFNAILDNHQYAGSKQCILILKRFFESEINIEGVSQFEKTNLHKRFIDDFWEVLCDEDFELYVQAKISELDYYCERIASASKKTFDQELPADKFWDMANAATENRYARYLESALMEFDFSIPDGKIQVNKFRYSQVALINSYLGIQIRKDNAAEIASKYGLTAKTSGEKLYQMYNQLCDLKKNEPKTARTRKNRVSLIKSILAHLPEDATHAAKNDIEKLELLLRKEKD